MKTFGIPAILVALLSTGLLAGVYYAYSTSVMLGLGHSDDRTFVEVFNRINVDIVNPMFMFSFLGSVLFTGIAGALYLRSDQRAVLLWVGVAFALNLLSLIISAAFNIPLNDKMAKVGDPATANFAALRKDFESAWTTWNIVRGLINTAAFGALGWALVQAGRG
ncbi:MAG: DUF1772 domain-containing protein [Mycobacteriaceae bacterium]|nr:DUF1772 domain-containing protein [Mycobacteriaceae bacterium]